MLMMLALITTIGVTDSTQMTGGPLRSRAFEAANVDAAAQDAWLGDDKFKHFAMSYAITAFGFAGARTLFESDASAALAIAAGAAAGLLKEFYDRAQGRPFSARDLVWDAAGVALGFIMVRQTSWK